MSAKRLFQMRSQGLLKSSYVTGAALRPLYGVISKTLKNLENSTLSQVRNNIIKASEEIERFKQYANLPPLYGVGGTAIGGYEPLPTPDPPYLPEQEGGSGYCLVLDLDETLVHSSFKPVPNADYVIPVEIDPGTLTDVYVLKRPYVDYFMEEMGKHYEIVVFTASLAKYADPLLDLLDVNNVIRWRLFRESCYPFQGNYVKDLTSLGRPLERTIILDNSPHSYAFQPQNALPISSFIDDPTDCDLLDAVPVLVELAKAADVAATLVANDGYLPRMRYAERGLPMPQNVEQWS